ncbi:MAG: hypothetical protein ACOZFS_09890 [Thermodesulfobacteriota bacterium]
MGYASCLRRCEDCGFGFSNARTAEIDRLTIVYRNPFGNIPDYIAAGHDEVLRQALNRINRSAKLLKFTSSKSEDHLTWTVFRYLQLTQEMGKAVGRLGIDFMDIFSVEPTLLLWGCPLPPQEEVGKAIQEKLIQVLDRLGENPQRRSEPDVILDYGERGIIFIEVKHGSPNDTKPAKYQGWRKYLRNTVAFRDTGSVRRTGFYELARNWRIAWDLAGDRPMALINLGPGELFQGTSQSKLVAFTETLDQGESRRFVIVSWRQFLDAMPPCPPWLRGYLDNRRVG